MFRTYFLVIFIIGCSTKPTSYKEGAGDREENGIRVSLFKGNSSTKLETARLFAEFRAVEACRAEEKRANILDIFDKTSTKEIIRSMGDGPSMYYGGMYPYYSRYSYGLGVGYSSVTSRSWSETQTFPYFEVYFNCDEKVIRPLMVFREIPANDMKHLVKDVKGGVQIEKIMDESPNLNAFKEGDIILKVNEKRIEKVYELIRSFSAVSTLVRVSFLRDGIKFNKTLMGRDVTQKVIETENEIIKRACDVQDKEFQQKPVCQKN